jgi:hypothetical protein
MALKKDKLLMSHALVLVEVVLVIVPLKQVEEQDNLDLVLVQKVAAKQVQAMALEAEDAMLLALLIILLVAVLGM